MAIDDCFFSSVHAVFRYIARNRAYRVLGISEDIVSWRPLRLRRIVEQAVRFSGRLQRLAKSEILYLDRTLGFTRDTHCIAFQKLAADTRTWDAHNEF